MLMDTKRVFQYSLLILLFVGSFLFYIKYFTDDTAITKKNKKENELEKKNLDISEDFKSKNTIENLKYITEDLLGNTYTVTAQSANLKEDKINEVLLFEVNAEIVRRNEEVIYIYSKTANYNKVNNNTVFKKKVNVNYGDQTINSEILNLNFNDNIIEILDNVYYFNINTKINADKVEIDLLDKKLKISMINEKDKVSISSNY
tara:strand:- start:3996 stop:4604 length:609 start_codon:yes stop_codon:yes gene_type:complete